MYEDVRKPKMLKDVPLLLIRPLPSLYYFSQFAGGDIPDTISELVSANIRFIQSAQTTLGESIGVNEFSILAEQFHEFCAIPQEQRKKKIEQLTRQLAELSTEHKTEIRAAMRELKTDLSVKYQKTVPTFSVLFVQYNGEETGPNKIIELLENFCFYQTQIIDRSDPSYSEKMIDTDFVIFNSTHPVLIHNDVISLSNFGKPGLAVVEVRKDKQPDSQSIRHAMQLLRSGFQVLFKVFTPIRLFTSIDREYVRYHLTN
jgi:hypothetical protein